MEPSMKKSKLEPSSSVVQVEGYVSDLSPMKKSSEGKQAYYVGKIETKAGEFAQIVGWSAPKRDLLSQFQENGVPVKFNLSSMKTEIMSNGQMKYRLPDSIRLEGATDVEFESTKNQKYVTASCISLGEVNCGKICPACGVKIVGQMSDETQIRCEYCNMCMLGEDCSSYKEVNAVFREQNASKIHHLKISKASLDMVGGINSSDEGFVLLKKIREKGPLILLVKNDLIIEMTVAKPPVPAPVKEKKSDKDATDTTLARSMKKSGQS